jgi:hypothetical protein
VSSRLVRAASGRPIAVEITVPAPLLEHGARFAVLGNELRRPSGIGWTGQTDARPPTPEEMVVPRAGMVDKLERREWSDADKERVRELWSAGWSWAQIASKVGCSKASVGTWLRQAAA